MKRRMCQSYTWGKFGLVLALLIALLGMTACARPAANGKLQAASLMESVSVSSAALTGKEADDAFIANTADFSIELFKKTIDSNHNSLVSALSVLLALAMTANGADRETLAQMESLLGNDMALSELNEYLYAYANRLSGGENGTLRIANSIWLHDKESHLSVEKDFLQTNADYYNAAAYRSAFDSQTTEDINQWVRMNTDGMIDRMVDGIDPNGVMYLINAVVFDAEWEKPYPPTAVSRDSFIASDGDTIMMDMMHSSEYSYVNDGRATGFIKPYINGEYSFVALLPNEDIAIDEYIASMTGTGWLNAIEQAESVNVHAALPKFSNEYAVQMNDALEKLGMPDAFSEAAADFSKLGHSENGNLFIGEVLHKTYISVSELGTKAGAATKVEMLAGSSPEFVTVKLDRPFIYAIIDRTTNLPIFIGTMLGK